MNEKKKKALAKSVWETITESSYFDVIQPSITCFGFLCLLRKKGIIREFDFSMIDNVDYYLLDLVKRCEDNTVISIWNNLSLDILIRNKTSRKKYLLPVVRLAFEIDIDLTGYLFEYLVTNYTWIKTPSHRETRYPESLTDLFLYLVKDKKNPKVYEPFVGLSNLGFLDNIRYYGHESSSWYYSLTKLRQVLMDKTFDYEMCDSVLHWNKRNEKYDVIIATHPNDFWWNRKLIANLSLSSFVPKNVEELFLFNAPSSLGEDGIAICIFYSSFIDTQEERKNEIIKMLLEDNLLDTVIILPMYMLISTDFYSTVFILRKGRKPSEPIRLVNASEITVSKRNKDLDVPQLISIMDDNNPEYVRQLTPEVLKKNDCSLSFGLYFSKELEVPSGSNSLQLKEILKRVEGKPAISKQHCCVVEYNKLSKDAFDYEREPSSFRKREVFDMDKEIDEPVLLIAASEYKKLRPTFVKASEEAPIYIDFEFDAFKIVSNQVTLPYLIYQLSTTVEDYKTGGLKMSSQTFENDFMNLPIVVPSIEEQEAIVKSAIEAAKQ